MTLNRLVGALEAAGVELDPAAIMDALWLAQHAPDLGTAEAPAPEPIESAPVEPADPHRLAKKTQSTPTPGPKSDPQSTPTATDLHKSMVDAFAGAFRGAGGRQASPFSIGAAPTLADRLALMRAVRPLQQRWRSLRDHELDEEATAELTAEVRSVRPDALVPVLRPRREPWFEVDIVLEADDAALLWSDTIGAFAQALRDTGAFRSVRRWRLVFERDAAGKDRPMLQSVSGARMTASLLNGAERRLILFATHGSGQYWQTGHYAAVLADWSRSAAVAVLPLLPERSWARTALGDADGTCSTDRPGTASGLLDPLPYWWSDIEPEQPCLALPLVALTPEAVSAWAAMLMSRGKPVPSLLLPCPMPPVRPDSGQALADARIQGEDMDRRIAALREVSGKGFELAVLLSQTTFTVPVARLIQEAHFGKVDQAALSELFVSGLLVAASATAQPAGDEAISTAYRIHPRAADLLSRSLRGRDALALAKVLMDRVSDHIRTYNDAMTSQVVFTLDEQGIFVLPEAVRPFAIVAAQLRDIVKPPAQPVPPKPDDSLHDRFTDLSPVAMRRLFHLARLKRPIAEAEVEPETWEALALPQLALEDVAGCRLPIGPTLALVEELQSERPLWGTRILWVDDYPQNNVTLTGPFRAGGAEVVTVLSTTEAMERLGEGFDLIISDMGRAEGEREGLVLLHLLHRREIAMPVIIFAGGYASVAANRQEALDAGAWICTNETNEVYAAVWGYLTDTPPQPLAPTHISRTERGENRAMILTGDHNGSRIHERSGEAIAILLESALRVPEGDIGRVTISEWLNNRAAFIDDFTAGMNDEPELGGGTLFIYAAGPIDWEPDLGGESTSDAAGPSIRSFAAVLAANRGVEQVVLIIDSAGGYLPTAFDGIDLPIPARPADDFSASPANLLSVTVHGGQRSRSDPGGQILPLTHALIEAVGMNASSGWLDGQELAYALKSMAPRCFVNGDTRFPFSVNAVEVSAATRTWNEYLNKGVAYANQRTPETDQLALQCYRRTLALRPDRPDREIYAKAVVYAAAMEKRLRQFEGALQRLREAEPIWSKTKSEDDAWYNIAAICAQTDRREEMLDAVFVIRNSTNGRASVMAHLEDYFARYASDQALLSLLSGKPPQHRNPKRLLRHEFFTDSEILHIAGEISRNERPRAALLLLETDTQQTWLVFTHASVLFMLDDADTRKRAQLHQKTIAIASAMPIRTRTEPNGQAVVGFGERKDQSWWYYSSHLFKPMADVVSKIESMISAVKENVSIS